MQERNAICGESGQEVYQRDHKQADKEIAQEKRLAPHGQTGVKIGGIRAEEPRKQQPGRKKTDQCRKKRANRAERQNSLAKTTGQRVVVFRLIVEADEIAGQDKQPEEKIADPERQCLSQAALENRAVKARGF